MRKTRLIIVIGCFCAIGVAFKVFILSVSDSADELVSPRGLHDIKLGMSMEEVKLLLGDLDMDIEILEREYGYVGVDGSFRDDPVAASPSRFYQHLLRFDRKGLLEHANFSVRGEKISIGASVDLEGLNLAVPSVQINKGLK